MTSATGLGVADVRCLALLLFSLGRVVEFPAVNDETTTWCELMRDLESKRQKMDKRVK